MPVYLHLLPLLDAYLDGEIPLYELRGQFYGSLQPTDAEDGLYRAVSMHLAMFTAGTWTEEELKASIRWHIASKAGQDPEGPIPMMDREWLDIMKGGLAPWPLTVETHD